MTASATTAIWGADAAPETFYAPAFALTLADQPVPDEVLRDVTNVKFTDNVNDVDRFDITVNNWDAELMTFKYAGGEPQSPSSGRFDPNKKVVLEMGYAGDLREMTQGQITTIEPDFPSSGQPLLTVAGLDVLYSLRKAQHTWGWEDKKVSEIAEELGRRRASGRQPGLGIDVRVDSAVREGEESEAYVFMNNEYDIAFLLRLARRRSLSLTLETDDQGAYLQLAPSQSITQETYVLTWPGSLLSFRPTLTTTGQIRKVTVRGWDRRSARAIEGHAELNQQDTGINRDLHAVAIEEGREEVITDRPVHSTGEANELARQILSGQLKEMVTATGATVGLPGLRAGRMVHILGLGTRFSGEYYVTQTTHTIGESGYRTEFTATREGPLS